MVSTYLPKTAQVAAFIAVLAFGAVAAAGQQDWSIIRLTDNAYDDASPAISDSNVVWQGWDGHDWEIFLYTGTTVQLTNNDYDDISPQISGANVVWQSWDGHDWEIRLYSNGTTVQLTNNSYPDTVPRVSGQAVVWQGWDGYDWEIFLYDGQIVTRLTDNTQSDWAPEVSGANVVWYGKGGADWEIFLYDGTKTIQLTDNTLPDYNPRISDSKVIWEHWDGHDYEIMSYDGSQIIQLTNNACNDWAPAVLGSQVAWCSGYDWQIFYYDGSTTTQLTSGGYNADPQVGRAGVVWWRQYEDQIYLHDMAATVQLTNAGFSNRWPQISDTFVVWQGWDGSDWEIFLAAPAPDIEVWPVAYDFGDVQIGESRLFVVMLTNVGYGQLTVSTVGLVGGSSGEFSVKSDVSMPASLGHNENIELEIVFSPRTSGLSSAVLQIASDDADEAFIQVELIGAGVMTEKSPSEKLAAILEFFDGSVGAGTLVGTGPGNSPGKRLAALRNMIEAAGQLIDAGFVQDAWQQLADAHKKVDGQDKPADFAAGSAAGELAAWIGELMANLQEQ